MTAFSYVVAGIEGTTGTASITANATAFTGAAQTATVVTITSGTPLVGALVTTSLTGGTVTVTP